MNKPRLNRKSKWRRQRQSRIRETDTLMKMWGSRYGKAKMDGNYPPVLLKMMANRATYWLMKKGDALMNIQTPMKKEAYTATGMLARGERK